MADRASISILHVHIVISHLTNMLYSINIFLFIVSLSKKAQVNGKNLLFYYKLGIDLVYQLKC